MAGGPLPVWRVEGAPSDEPSPTGPLTGSPLEWFAFLYRRCALAHGWTPEQVNRLEVWEAAAALGEATRAHEDRPASGQAGVSSSGRDLVAERVRAHREGRPPPDVDPMSPGQVAMMQERLRVG